MKILNRPMFRYGGPIKEGIMDGIQEPKRGRVDGPGSYAGRNDAELIFEKVAKGYDSPIIDQSMSTSSPFLRGNNQVNQKYLQNDDGQTTKEIINNFSGSISQVPKPAYTQEDWRFKKESDRVEADQRKRDYMENMNVDDKYVDGYNEQTGQKEKVLNVNYGKDKYMESPTVNIKSGDNPFNYKDNADPNTITDGKKLPEIKTIDTEGNRKKSINNILEKLGYARSQKNALYDALIAGGQRISREGLGKTNLVNDLIADTSTAYDKPEKIREAAELMQVQQDLKLEGIRESKTNQMEEEVNYLISQGMTRQEALDTKLKLPTTSSAAFEEWNAKTKDLPSAVRVGVEYAVKRGEFDAPIGVIDSKKYKNGKEFLKTNPEAGNYIFKGRIISISDNGKAETIKTFYRTKKDEGFWSGLFGSKEEPIG